MKRPDVTLPPQPWRDLAATPAPESDDRRIGRLLRRMPPPAPLSQRQLESVAQRLGQTPARTASPAGVGARLRRRWAVIVALIAGTSGVVFAQRQLARRWHDRAAAITTASAAGAPAPTAATIPAAPAAADPAAGSKPTVARGRIALVTPPDGTHLQRVTPIRRGSSRTAPAATDAIDVRPEIPSERGVASVDPIRARAPNGTSGRGRTALLPEPDHSRLPLLSTGGAAARPRPHDGRLGDESALLRQALQSLRHDDDARGALDALDEYDQRFPFGVLRPNAALVRIDATLALGRHDEAGRLLDQIDLHESPRRDELEVVRAELRGPSGCPAAIPAFSAVLARDPPAAIAERALRGRARCAIAQGQQGQARADLTLYLDRFPQGPLAAEARQRLGR